MIQNGGRLDTRNRRQAVLDLGDHVLQVPLLRPVMATWPYRIR